MKISIFASNDAKDDHFRRLVKKDIQNKYFYRINAKDDDN